MTRDFELSDMCGADGRRNRSPRNFGETHKHWGFVWVIEGTKNLVTLKIPSQSGVQETTLYDLTVFNYLVMRLGTQPHTY